MKIKKTTSPDRKSLSLPFSSALLKRSLVLWIMMIGVGVLAYGFGLYQGSQHRSEQLERSMASEPQH